MNYHKISLATLCSFAVYKKENKSRNLNPKWHDKEHKTSLEHLLQIGYGYDQGIIIEGETIFFATFRHTLRCFFPLFFVHKWQYKRENMCFVIVFGLCVDHGYIALKILWCTLNTLFEINSLFPWFYDCVGVDVYIAISYVAIKMERNSALTIF